MKGFIPDVSYKKLMKSVGNCHRFRNNLHSLSDDAMSCGRIALVGLNY